MRLTFNAVDAGNETDMISALSHLARLGRAGFVFAREGVLALVDPKPLPLRRAWGCASPG